MTTPALTPRDIVAMTDTELAAKIAPMVTNRLIDVSARGRLANSGHNVMYAGDRDMDYILGRKMSNDITPDMILERFERDSIANSVVNKPVNATWRRPPSLNDGSLRDTDFVLEWEKLIDRLDVWGVFKRLDKLATMHRFAVLLMGFSDVTTLADLASPVQAGESGLALTYIQPYGERSIFKIEHDLKPQSPRFNKPEYYTLIQRNVDAAGEGSQEVTMRVHHSRVIHVAQGELETNGEGLPAFLPIWNDLDDIVKIDGGAAEAFWRNAAEDVIVELNDSVNFPDDAAKAKFRSEIEDRVHRLVRSIIVKNATTRIERGQQIDPTGAFSVKAKKIAGQTGIPQRILFGSEAAQLASEQDESNWASTIAERQLNYAAPKIVRPFINKMVEVAIIPPNKNTYHLGDYDPTSGQWSWPSIEQMSEKEEADIADKRITALQKAVDVVMTVPDALTMGEARGYGGLTAELPKE